MDAIGVKNALRDNTLSRERLLRLRDSVDALAERHPDVSFISLADSLVLKGSWSVGHFQSSIPYTYAPETFIRIVEELRGIYRDTLALDVYAVLTQGSNEYYDDSLLHISRPGNHVCLNSLGIPFAELLAIDAAVAASIKDGSLKAAELYMDDKCLHSIGFKFEFDRDSLPRNPYKARMMSSEGTYYSSSIRGILDNLRNESE